MSDVLCIAIAINSANIYNYHCIIVTIVTLMIIIVIISSPRSGENNYLFSF